MPRPAGIFLALLALLLFLPAPCPAADSTAEPAPNSAAKAVPKAALDPDMDEGHRLFAHANYEKALEHYLKALERNKEDAYLYFRIGLTYYMLDDMDNSHVHWLKSYDFDPDLPDSYGFKVNSVGMLPTLFPGDRLTIDDKYYKSTNAKHGDVIFYLSPDNDKTLLANRIVGLPKDTIEISKNYLIRNDMYVQEKYLYRDGKKNSNATITMNKLAIPESCIFVLGDNRNWSYDSRYHGCVKINKIVGRALVVVQSFKVVDGKQIEREERFGLEIN